MKWRDMKIGKKLAVGFGIILILLGAISIYNINSFIGTRNLNNEATTNLAGFSFMLEKQIDHLN